MVILELNKDGSIQETPFAEEQLLEEFVNLSESHSIVSVTEEEVTVLRGGVTLFYLYLREFYPGRRLLYRIS